MRAELLTDDDDRPILLVVHAPDKPDLLRKLTKLVNDELEKDISKKREKDDRRTNTPSSDKATTQP